MPDDDDADHNNHHHVDDDAVADVYVANLFSGFLKTLGRVRALWTLTRVAPCR